MKKNSLFVGIAMLSGSISFAQPVAPMVEEVIIANGGVFEFSMPYADYATVGSYNIGLQSYQVFDTIYTQSVQDIAVTVNFGASNPSEIFVAAEDSVIKYDQGYQRLSASYFESIRSVTALEDEGIVVAGNWFGSTNALTVFDYNTMAPLYSVSTSDIPYTIYGAAVLGDSLYVSYNIPSSVDGCPPYGCYADSIGMLGVISLTSQSYVRSVSLGTAAAGLRKIAAFSNEIRGAGTLSGNSIAYDNSTESVTSTSQGIYNQLNFEFFNEGLHFIDGTDVNSLLFYNSSVAPTNLTVSFPLTAIYDSYGTELFYTETDYASYGRLFHKTSGPSLDSIEVGVSPEAIAFRYSALESIDNQNEIDISIYPNPNNGRFHIKGAESAYFEVFNTTGQKISEGLINGPNQELSLNVQAGIYIIKVVTEYGIASKSVIID